VAADIARALGGFEKQQDYFESDEYVLSSAVGHLLSCHEPEQYEVNAASGLAAPARDSPATSTCVRSKGRTRA